MANFSAREAAALLNHDEKTIRRWIHSGRLKARYAGRNRFAIDEKEIERIQREERQSTRGDLERRIERLEKEIAHLSAQLVAGESFTKSLSHTRTKNNDRRARSPRPTDETLINEADLTAGSRRASEFAESHGVQPKTFRYHMLTGLAGERVNHLAIRKPARGTTEIERWLSEDQQRATLAFWERHHVAFKGI